MQKVLALGLALLAACKQGDAPPPKTTDNKPAPTSDAGAPSGDASAKANDPPRPMPRAKRGLLAYTKTTYGKDGAPAPHFLWLVDADGGAPLETSIEFTHSIKGAHHLLSGYADVGGRWLLDLRSPNLVTKPQASDIDFVTPDDRLVWRCSGGLSKPFEVCISDPDGSNKRVLLSEPANASEPGIVTAAGRTLVHGSYAGAKPAYVKPPFSLSIADGTRTNYPALVDARKVGSNDGNRIELFYSPSGTKAVSCTERLHVTTFDGSIKPRSFPIPGGVPTRCTCRFSNDDKLLACSILQRGQATEDLEVWNLETGAKTLLAKNISIGEFAIAPDATEVAYVTNVNVEEQETELVVTSVDGKATRTLDKLAKGRALLTLHAWTAPN